MTTNSDLPVIFEQAIIGSMICPGTPEAEIAKACSTEWFVDPRNQNIYGILYEAAQSSMKLNAATLVAAIEQSGWKSQFFGSQSGAVAGYIDQCVAAADGGMAWKFYAERLSISYGRIVVASKLDAASLAASEASTVAELATSVLEPIVDASIELTSIMRSGGDNAMELSGEFEQEYGREFDSIPFPQANLNTMGGIQRSQIAILAAYTGQGKSWLGLDWMLAFAKEDRRCWLYTLEMSWIQMWQRLIAMVSGHELRDIVQKKLPWQSLKSYNERLQSMPINIRKTSTLTVDRMITEFIASGDERPEVIFIDHMHLMDFGPDLRSMDTGLSRIKTFAVEYDVAVVLIAQLSRPENRISIPKPSIYMLRNSGAIEQIADYIIFVHKNVEEAYGREYHTMWTAKQRQGEPAKEFEVLFDGYRFRPTEALHQPVKTQSDNQGIGFLSSQMGATVV